MDAPNSRGLEVSGRLIAKNTILNFVGQVVPLLIGILAIPYIVRGLGTSRFGVLSLTWVVLGYFTIFDLGLGRATTKYVAEALGKGDPDQFPRIAWTAITVQGLFGMLGALVLAGITPLLVERILNIPPQLVGEAKATFYVLAIAIPIILVSSSFFGVLEAAQRFDLTNAVRIPSGASTYLLPLVGLLCGANLPGIVMLILIARLVTLSALLVLNIRVFPKLRKFSPRFALFPRLFTYGGWVTVSSIVGPILVSLDRFLMGSLLSITAVAYYTAPYEAVTRFWIIPVSLTMSLFPALSALEGIGDRQKLGTLFARSLKYVLLALGPIVLMVALFAAEGLQIWLGSDFATQSTPVLQILAFGVLVNSIAHIPYTLLQGVGRPDIPAKFHLFELPIYIGIAWVLVSHWGIAGAAAAWTIRVSLDALLLFVAVFRVCRFSPWLLAANGLTLTSLALVLLAGIAYGLKSLTSTLSLFAQSAIFISLLGIFAFGVWRNILDDSDRGAVLNVVKPWQRSENVT